MGDESDGVPKVPAGTELDDRFISFLKKKEIYVSTIEEFENLHMKNELMKEFLFAS
jgi:hypothetical protein